MGTLLVVALAGCQGATATLTETRAEEQVQRSVSAALVDGPAGPRLLVDHYDPGDPAIGDTDLRIWIALDLVDLPEPSDTPLDLPIDATLHYAQEHLSGGTWLPDGTWGLTTGEAHDPRVRAIELYWGAYADATATYEAQLAGVVHLTRWDATSIAGRLVVDVEGRLPYRSTGTYRLTLDFEVAR